MEFDAPKEEGKIEGDPKEGTFNPLCGGRTFSGLYEEYLKLH
jgi:hypothetical protein